ncbi:hypothetical protein M2262_000171 [Pseudomonas sp. BIGb0408]|uniref:Uncharacterized protein n=1 Tax=Phytopseudomonas flavescens TaxID=29435 RepID=A0A7Z0BSK0_9GAMM|nr:MULTISPECIES: hypothetical protein [Pseudomonas]MCW2290121.1 hypothetical protein [Pseudomonas sp. BIGb0408]NYH75306.1 hypothetical protein [Pseudomonas flavescens]
MTEAGVGIYIAGIYLDPLMENLDKLEERFKGLDLYAELADRLDDSFDMMNAARAYWVNAEAEPKNRARAAKDILAVWHGFDSAVQEIEFSDLNALAHTVRRCIHPSKSAKDSGLMAALAICYAVEGLREVYDYQIELSQSHITSVPKNLTGEFPDLRQVQLERARAKLVLNEINARVSHADYVGEARLAMFAAGIHHYAESRYRAPRGYRIGDKMLSAINLSRSSAGGAKGAKTNRAQATENARLICTEEGRLKRLDPHISPSEFVARLCETKNLSPPTIRKHLRSLGLYPDKKRL